ncbi:suppressor of hpr1 [Conglomerata obtusa]
MQRLRFEKELEFVQLLCNPEYLQFLYQQNYFHSADFIIFLKYLRYWHKYPYKNFLIYPQCLEILELCLNEHFVSSLANENTFLLLSEQMYYMWNNES